MTSDPTVIKMLNEVHQTPETRQGLMKRLERSKKFRNHRVLLYFTSFRYPVAVGNDDANIIEGVLQKTDRQKELLLIINSPGGDALAAERIINICQSYSDNGYCVLVPKMAKSAATIIAFGSRKIYMSPTSELGPIDPQVRIGNKRMSAYSIIESYKALLEEAVMSNGRIEPYLQQLENYDPREIKELESVQALSDDIAVKALQHAHFKDHPEDAIRNKIELFLTPEQTKVHGRAIYPDILRKEVGLDVEILDTSSQEFNIIWELFVRADYTVNTNMAKLVETAEHNFAVPAPK